MPFIGDLRQDQEPLCGNANVGGISSRVYCPSPLPTETLEGIISSRAWLDLALGERAGACPQLGSHRICRGSTPVPLLSDALGV